MKLRIKGEVEILEPKMMKATIRRGSEINPLEIHPGGVTYVDDHDDIKVYPQKFSVDVEVELPIKPPEEETE